jgi:hypothetical protein
MKFSEKKKKMKNWQKICGVVGTKCDEFEEDEKQ